MCVHTQYDQGLKFHLLLSKGPERVKVFPAKAYAFSIKMLQMEIAKFHFSALWCTHTILLRHKKKKKKDKTPNVLKKENFTA